MSSPSILKISFLIWQSLTSVYAMYTMMSYFTDVWDVSFTHAASIMNLFWGLTMLGFFGFKFLADAFLGSFTLLLFSCFAFLYGSGLLWMSTPPVLSRATGTCGEYKPECIGRAQKTLVYVALPLIALGLCCHYLFLQSFVDQQKSESERRLEISEHGIATFLVYSVPLAGIVAIPFIKPWSIKFAIPAICSVIGTTIFLTGLRSYVKTGPQGRDKALASFPLIVEVIPVSLMIIVPALVLSIGNTYFLEQANMMTQTMFGLKIPVVLAFMPFYGAVKHVFRKCRSPGLFSYFKMEASMFFMALSCVAAAAVEKRRLGVAKKAGMIDTDKSVPMNMFWLLPRVLLMAAGDGIFSDCIPDFFRGKFPNQVVDYVEKFADGVAGIGYMGSALLVYVVGKISENGGKSGWFHHSMNKSRLDNYYWTLAAMVAINFVVFGFVGCFCGPKSLNEDGELDEEDRPLADEAASKVAGFLNLLY